MKFSILSATQDEFDKKRPLIIKAVAGKKFDVIVRLKGQKLSSTPREPVHPAQQEMLDFWDKKFRTMLRELKGEVDAIIG